MIYTFSLRSDFNLVVNNNQNINAHQGINPQHSDLSNASSNLDSDISIENARLYQRCNYLRTTELELVRDLHAAEVKIKELEQSLSKNQTAEGASLQIGESIQFNPDGEFEYENRTFSSPALQENDQLKKAQNDLIQRQFALIRQLSEAQEKIVQLEKEYAYYNTRREIAFGLWNLDEIARLTEVTDFFKSISSKGNVEEKYWVQIGGFVGRPPFGCKKKYYGKYYNTDQK